MLRFVKSMSDMVSFAEISWVFEVCSAKLRWDGMCFVVLWYAF